MRKPITTAILAALVGAGGVLAPSYDVLATAPSSSGVVKALVPKGVIGKNQPGAQLLEDYGSFALYRVDQNALRAAQAASSRTQTDSEADSLLFTAHPFDTQRDTLTAPAPFALASAGPGLQIVQFVGPVKQQWLDAMAAHGIVPVHYVANSGYIVWADQAALAQLSNLRNTTSWLQYNAPFHGFLKVDTRLGDRIKANPAANDEVDIVVQVYSHPGVDATKQFVVGKGLVPPQQLGPMGPGAVDYQWGPVLKFENLSLRVRLSDIASIAERPDVTFVGEKVPRRLMDEKQDIIMTGDLTPGPASIDYLQWLIDHGFSQNKDDYPLVDLTDSTIDEGGSGVTVLNTADQMLRVGGDPGGAVRVDYFHNCSSTPDTQVGAIDGHGSLNAGIIVGYDQRSGSPYQDTDGHQLGLGINPFGRVGSTAIFVPGYDISHCGNTDLGVIKANWQSGGRISSNSWGLTVAPTTYDDGDQAYDIGTRDADNTQGGNQEMIYIFAAANLGPGAGSVSSPASGKNVLTVGASENVRNQWTDGCGIGPSGADNANDVISFSGRGPAPGQRAKPEVIGPGTHIQSGASNFSGYTGTGVCDKYHPTGQTVFAASSGTSHSTPETSGIASLSWWWIEQGGAGSAAGTVDEIGGNRAPSPALMKAWMMAHPTYLTGVSANDNLPSNSQGYGMPNMTLMFDDTPKVLLDQSETFDNSGETRTYTWGVVDPSKPVRIALAWTDEPGQLGTSPQVNNLDLTVTVGGQTYLGNHFTHAVQHHRRQSGHEEQLRRRVPAGRHDRRHHDHDHRDQHRRRRRAEFGRRYRPGFRPRLQQLLAGADVHADDDIGRRGDLRRHRVRRTADDRPDPGLQHRRQSRRERQSVRHDRGRESACRDAARYRDARRDERYVGDAGRLHGDGHRHIGCDHQDGRLPADVLHAAGRDAGARFAAQRRELDAAAAGVHVGGVGSGFVVPLRARDRFDLHQHRDLANRGWNDVPAGERARCRHRVLLACQRDQHLRQQHERVLLVPHRAGTGRMQHGHDDAGAVR